MSVLRRIYEIKRQEVELARTHTPLSDLKSQAADAQPTRGFLHALSAVPGLGLIAEIKKASPSKGLIREHFDAREIAEAYERAGAHCLSVLTDEQHFQGSPENLRIAKASTNLPCLRKDFLYDEYQVFEARSWGADAILLIVAMLEPAQIVELQALAQSLGMDVLVEVHDEREAEIALEANAKLVGVNNRNLNTFETSLDTSIKLLPTISKTALAVSESALETRADLDAVQQAGAKAVLIGTTFCASTDIESKVKEVMGW